MRYRKQQAESGLQEARFDRLAYFRNLNNFAINLKNKANKNRSTDIDAMFELVAQGKLAAETLPDAEKHALLAKIQQVTSVSSATLGLDGPAGNTTSKRRLDADDPDPLLSPGIQLRGETDNFAQQPYYDGSKRKEAEPEKSGILDRRELEFNESALLAVILSSADEQAQRPTNIEFNDECITVVRGPNHSMTLTCGQIGSLLIRYCIKMKIPIPHASAKSLRITSNSVIILFTRELPAMPIRAMTWLKNDRLR